MTSVVGWRSEQRSLMKVLADASVNLSNCTGGHTRPDQAQPAAGHAPESPAGYPSCSSRFPLHVDHLTHDVERRSP
eukprot:5779950-Pyramimonas_sp.AAC.1